MFILNSFYFRFFSIILISLVGIIDYSNSFHCSFHFDDTSSIINNFAIRNLDDLQSIWNYLPRRFILYLSLAFNYHFSQLNVFGYHLFNLTVHVLSAILVWWFTLLTLSTPVFNEVKKVKGGFKVISQIEHPPIIALFTGLVFVSHPLQTQAITYIVQRSAAMATLLYLASLCFYVKFRLTGHLKSNSGLSKFYYLGALICAVLAMFTKEIAITLPLMILLYEYTFLKIQKGFNWSYTIPFLLTLAIIPLTRMLTESPEAQHMRGVLADGPAGISSWHYLLTQFRVITTYLRLLFLPFNQNLDYDYYISHNLFAWPVLASLSFLLIILWGAKRLFAQYRLLSFSIFWFFLTLLPESSIFPIRDVIFEHRLYLPLVGYSLFVVMGLYYLLGKKKVTMLIILLTVLAAGNSVLTYQRNKVWENEFTLWNDTVLKSPHKARVYVNRGNSYDSQGDLNRAMADYTKAIEINPQYADAYYNRGVTYNDLGKKALAMADFNQAIELNPIYVEAYTSRGALYAQQNNFAQAMSDYSKAIDINPTNSEAYYNRAVSYYQLQEYDKAWDDVHKAEELGEEVVNPKFVAALARASGRAQ